jgi:hypothetical protein
MGEVAEPEPGVVAACCDFGLVLVSSMMDKGPVLMYS